ncbi:hypothetical protein [Nocardioides stalactiti]|uniref:hypothetical protein n=1 Tax=Nocardioides stalactiti TaxID=2755356 RepID=UPI001604459C|nr:hypothetical protein [Nocardioides stalactiti]
MTSPAVSEPARPRRGSLDWWVRSKDGRLAIAQFPNPAIFVWLAAVGLGQLDLSEPDDRTLGGIRHGALLVWGLDELVRGSSPFRRVLGAGVLAFQLWSLWT